MKRSAKKYLYSFTIICSLLLFLAYSNGLSFSLHSCESCHQTKLFFYQHPNCCAESAHIHESEKKCAESCGCTCDDPSDKEDISFDANNEIKVSENHLSGHNHKNCNCTKHSCKTTHKYFRIAAPFVISNQTQLAPTLITLSNQIEILKCFDITPPLYQIPAISPPPLLTKAGERDFLHFISQQILYA